MADLIVITPSRGRPRQLNELAHAVRDTTDGRADVLGLVDLDDPDRAAYQALPVQICVGDRRSLSGWTNHEARHLTGLWNPPRYLASLGDDHRPRTQDWDRLLIDAIEAMDGPGWAYGDDLLQGPNNATAWVQSAVLVDVLGWMMLPEVEHLYVDNAVLSLGQQAGRLTYRPDVVIEHLHPAAGKAVTDETYAANHTDERYTLDGAAFAAWRDGGGLAACADKVKALQYPTRGSENHG